MQDTTAEYFLYDGDNVVDSYAANGNLNARYVTSGLDGNLSGTRGGKAYYCLADGLGSIRNVLSANETVQNTYDYYAFGNTLGTPTVNVTNPFEYTAREFEDGSVNTTFYYRNRYYMSALGIFTSRDSRRYDLARGWWYLHHRPVDLTDPYGYGLLNWILKLLGVRTRPTLDPNDPSLEDDPNAPLLDSPADTGSCLGDEMQGTALLDTQRARQDTEGASQGRVWDSECQSKGWKPGDPIDALTPEGKLPKWPTVRDRFWKNEALNNAANYDEADLERMRQGLTPQYQYEPGKWESYQLHHEPPQSSGNLFRFRKVTRQEHWLIHYGKR